MPYQIVDTPCITSMAKLPINRTKDFMEDSTWKKFHDQGSRRWSGAVEVAQRRGNGVLRRDKFSRVFWCGMVVLLVFPSASSRNLACFFSRDLWWSRDYISVFTSDPVLRTMCRVHYGTSIIGYSIFLSFLDWRSQLFLGTRCRLTEPTRSCDISQLL